MSLAREDGVDVTTGAGLDRLLPTATALIDVTNSPSRDEGEATAFFMASALHLGAAALRHGLRRVVLLSIIGVDRVPDGYYAAKLAQEEALRRAFDGVVVLRSAQFHEFAAQTLEWGREQDRCVVPDMPIQPVALATVAETLADLATAAEVNTSSSIAGPRQERLVDMVAQVADADGLEIEIVAHPVGKTVRDGALLPDALAKLVGQTFAEWLAARTSRGDRRIADSNVGAK